MKKMGRPTKSEVALRAKEKAELEMMRRTGGRLKKTKKVFDPSENYVRKRRKTISNDKNEHQLAKDEPASSKAKETTTVQPYLKLQALDELLTLNEDQYVEPELNKTDDVREESPAILEDNSESKDSDTEFTPDVKKVQKKRFRRKKHVRKRNSQKNIPIEADPEFRPDGSHKNIKQRKQKLLTLENDAIQLIKLPESNPNQTENAVADPVVKPQRGRPCKRAKTDFISVCAICLRSNSMELITCLDCNTKAHKNCLKTNFKNKKLGIKWHCDNCKICEICYETYEIGKIITCSLCVKSYHTVCHVPTIVDDSSPNFDQANWVCTRCANKMASCPKNSPAANFPNNDTSKTKSPLTTSMHNSSDALENENDLDKSVIPGFDHKLLVNKVDNKSLLKSEELKTSALQTELNLPIPKVEKIKEKCNAPGGIDAEDIPDVSTWSCEKLSQFISEIFPNEAHVFLDHEIDGAALLLLTRSFVLTALGLKLGPALRLYNFIITLQTRKHDEFATWY